MASSLPRQESGPGEAQAALAQRLARLGGGLRRPVRCPRGAIGGALDDDHRPVVLAGAPDPANPASVPPEALADWVAEGVVEHAGYVDDMAALLRGVHIACLPSYREGLPLYLLEAAASGRPAVTTDVPGCREAVADGENGLLVPVRDGAALAEALERLITDPHLRARLGANARERVVSRFAEDRVIRGIFDVYEQLLGRPVGRERGGDS